jgi:hypothetical protein
MHEMLVREKQSEGFWDLSQDQQNVLMALIQAYKQAIEFREAQQMRMQMMMSEMGGGAGGGGQ